MTERGWKVERAVMFGLLFFFSLQAQALPVVSLTDFVPGRAWTWDYTTSDGKPWSTERYTVISVQGTQVLLEISSDYNGAQNLKPNTRILADVSRCLNAYSNPVAKKGWSIQMFGLSAGHWTEFTPPTTLAFEEKFNCNGHEFTGASGAYLTARSVIDGVSVFQQKLWRKLSSSWFATDLPLQAGIAYAKDFKDDPAMSYSFKLRLLPK